jgi:DNA sulfur modification protein DndD
LAKFIIEFKIQTKEVFEQTVTQYEKVRNEISELDKSITKIESDLEDEEIIEYTTKKREAERKNEKYVEDKGALLFQKENLKKENEKLLQKYHFLLKKIDVSKHKKK